MNKTSTIHSLRAKILLFAALPVVLILTAVIGLLVTSSYRHQIQETLVRINLETAKAAREIERGSLEAVTIAHTMALAQENGLFGSRSESILYARRILEKHPNLTGAYFGYEPNADGNDQVFLTKAIAQEKSATDKTGRFLPYWFRDKDDPSIILMNPLIDMEKSFYYQGVKNKINEIPETHNIALATELSIHYIGQKNQNETSDSNIMVTEPYDYEGKLIVEQTYPIVRNGKFVGIAGVDRSLTQVAEFLQQLKPFRTSDFILISQRGRIISATMDSALNTKRIEDTPYSNVLLEFYNEKYDSQARLMVDPVKFEEYYYDASKIPTGNWTLVMRVSRAEILVPIMTQFRRSSGIAIVGLVFIFVILVWLANSVTRRLAVAVRLADQVAAGDLKAEVSVSGNDETATLLRAIQSMIENLNALIGQVKQSSVELLSAASDITNAARNQQEGVNHFGSSTSQIATALTEIAATSRELTRSMENVNRLATETGAQAVSGRGSLDGMASTMDALQDATSSISSRLTTIREKANNINSIIKTITKVADQTNLLSLNASIEAHKAGDYGLGFSVVANEIQRLADQSAVATLDIEKIVKEMHDAVSAGVTEMERFIRQVSQGVTTIAKVNEVLGSIIKQVEHISPQFEVINRSMQSQLQGTQHIKDAVLQLNDVARDTQRSLQQFDSATSRLHHTVDGLRLEVSRFKVE
ncbi:methyl-accepting chemotaxis protein [bacterium]|nr:methyl-accepting chemotaxis protein [bacterium]MCI0604971.1 methyl-accepting chemotaxis protein [bacterium]